MSFINREETKEALEYIRKESLDIYNRLHSIGEDIKFVHLVHEAYSEHDIPFLRKSHPLESDVRSVAYKCLFP